MPQSAEEGSNPPGMRLRALAWQRSSFYPPTCAFFHFILDFPDAKTSPVKPHMIR